MVEIRVPNKIRVSVKCYDPAADKFPFTVKFPVPGKVQHPDKLQVPVNFRFQF